MTIPEFDSITLVERPANQAIIEDLYRKGYINQGGRDQALRLLYPDLEWGRRIAQLAGILGAVFISFSIFYFFAFNWGKIAPLHKLLIIEMALLCSLLGAWTYSGSIAAKLFLSGACALIGVFLAVYGQIYPSGEENTYQWLIAWSLLISPFVIISRFFPLWVFWYLLLNFTLVMVMGQYAYYIPSLYYTLFVALAALNILFLILHENLPFKKRYVRIMLLLIIFSISFIPILEVFKFAFLGTLDRTDLPLIIAAILMFSLQLGLLLFYRLSIRDRWGFAIGIISLCLICTFVAERTIRMFSITEMTYWLLLGVAAFFIFSIGSAFVLKMRVSRW